MSQPNNEVSYTDNDGDKLRYVLEYSDERPSLRLIKYVNGVKKVGDGTNEVCGPTNGKACESCGSVGGSTKGVVTRISYRAYNGRISDQHGWGGIIPKEHLPVLRKLVQKANVDHDITVAAAEAPKGTLQVNEDYLEGCKGKSFLFSKAVSAKMGQGFQSLALISEVKRKLQTEGAKMGAGTSKFYLTNNGFEDNKKLGFDSIISNETLDLHDPGLEDWTKCYQTYAAATKYGVLILAKTPANFQVWAQSKACLNEVKGIPDGRLFVYIEHTEDDEGGAQGYICCVQSVARKTSATVANGRGYLLFANGNYYHGDLKNGDTHGNGMHRHVSGDVYVGAWENRNKNGKGKETFAESGNVYDGNWKDGKKHGKGEFTWLDGDVYYGDWEDDNMHGKGKYVWANGNVRHDGEWKDDKPHGK